METQIKELMDRTRRIETKVTRLLNGEDDKGVTHVDYNLLPRTTTAPDILTLRSPNVTVGQLAKILEDEVLTGEVDVHDNGRYVLTVSCN